MIKKTTEYIEGKLEKGWQRSKKFPPLARMRSNTYIVKLVIEKDIDKLTKK